MKSREISKNEIAMTLQDVVSDRYDRPREMLYSCYNVVSGT